MSYYFTRILVSAFTLTFTLGVARNSLAQSAQDKIVIRPVTAQGSAAFMFTINGLGAFGIGSTGVSGDTANQPYMLFGIGAKWFFMDDVALRMLFAFTTANQPAPGSSVVVQNTSQFGIGMGIEKHFRPLYSISPYVGGQLSFAGHSTNDGNTGASEHKTNSSTFGVAGLAGFDWFFTHGIAAGAEMALGLASTSTSATSGSNTTDLRGPTNIALATGGNVHLVVYF